MLNYKIQRNLCKKVFRKIKKSLLAALIQIQSRIIDPFCENLFLFPQKGEKNIATVGVKNISEDKKLSQTLNNFF